MLQGDTPLHREHIVMYIIIALFPDYYHYAYKILLATCIYKDGLELARHTQTDRSRGPKGQRKVHLYIYIFIDIYLYIRIYFIFLGHLPRKPSFARWFSGQILSLDQLSSRFVLATPRQTQDSKTWK